MKKTLLLGSFAIFGLMANAQLVTEVSAETCVAAGFNEDKSKSDIAANVVFGEGPAGTIQTAFADSWGITDAYGGYKNVIVGDTEVTLGAGAVGNTNPKLANYAAGMADVSGAVFLLKPAANGWVTIFTKMNPNKQYVVFEGKSGAMAYTLGYFNVDDTYGEVKIHYTLPYDPKNYRINFNADDASTYFKASGGDEPNQVVPQMPWYTSGLFTEQAAADPEFKYEAQKTGFLTFNVVKGQDYYVCALGSKAAMGTFVLTEGDVEPSVQYMATDDLPAVTFDGGNFNAGIEGIIADPINENAPVYNLFGQKVNDTYKGIVIKNGKKFIQR